ncbi:MAG TPA: glutaredoxin 3 [Burkholderiales bacterium]|nr:glutaredoxin 3 [Burkholderiales bacterium]
MTRSIVMYASDWCGHCARARALLDAKGVAYTEIDVDLVPGAREEMVARGGGSTVPQVFVDAQPLGGSEELRALDAAGRLDSMLKNGA